ncbi:membrane-spanning 4-domains subfamily A member 4A-like [Lissotriton helveticus]
MAAPSGNGIFVVTQYIPAASSSPLHPGSLTSQTPCFLQKFIKGEPKALGVVQIMIGIVSICLGGILSTNFAVVIVVSGVPFWGAVFYFISGGLSISAEKRGTRCLVIGSLVMNIFSSIAAGISIIFCCVDLGFYESYDDCYNDHNSIQNECWYYKDAFNIYRCSLLGVLLLLSFLEFFVSVAVSCFGCKSVCNSSSPSVAQPLFVVQNAGSQDPRVLPMQATGVPLTIGQGMPLMQGMPMPYGLSTAPAAQGVTSAPTAVPPPFYYKDVPGDAFQP